MAKVVWDEWSWLAALVLVVTLVQVSITQDSVIWFVKIKWFKVALDQKVMDSNNHWMIIDITAMEKPEIGVGLLFRSIFLYVSFIWSGDDRSRFLDALASLDLKLSVAQWVIDIFTASASTGLSDYFVLFPICYCMNDPPSSSFFLQTCVQGKLRRLSSTQTLRSAFLSPVTFLIHIPSIKKTTNNG